MTGQVGDERVHGGDVGPGFAIHDRRNPHPMISEEPGDQLSRGQLRTADDVTPAISSTAPSRGEQDPSVAPVRHGLPPTNGWDLLDRARNLYGFVYTTRDRHDVLASRWDFLNSWSKLAVALAASLSAVSLIASNEALTAVFAITTAVVSAVNAAWDPATRAARHRVASREFRRLGNRLYPLVQRAQSGQLTGYRPNYVYDETSGQYRDEGQYYQMELSDEELKELSSELLKCEEEIDKIADSGPALSHLWSHDPYRVPRTAWGVHRLERRIKRERNTAELFGQLSASMPGPGLYPRDDADASVPPKK